MNIFKIDVWGIILVLRFSLYTLEKELEQRGDSREEHVEKMPYTERKGDLDIYLSFLGSEVGVYTHLSAVGNIDLLSSVQQREDGVDSLGNSSVGKCRCCSISGADVHTYSGYFYAKMLPEVAHDLF